MAPTFDTDRLQTVKNFADAYPNRKGGKGVSVSYMMRLIKEGKVPSVVIDGMRFVVLPGPLPEGE